jgi:uncharacterized protein YbjT (DUF2867 family)
MIAVVAGGTGLVGRFLLEILDADPAFTEVRALSRRAQKSDLKKVKWVEVNFDEPQSLDAACDGVNVAFCCLGTTIKKAGSQEAFRKVDHGYVIAFAKAAKKGRAAQFHTVSAIGASAKSSVFYSRVKGEAEEAVQGMGFKSLGIYQPSFLEGPREEPRLGEKIGGVAMKLLSPLMLGGLSIYKPIHVKTVASAMVAMAGKHKGGKFTYPEMMAVDAAG